MIGTREDVGRVTVFGVHSASPLKATFSWGPASTGGLPAREGQAFPYCPLRFFTCILRLRRWGRSCRRAGGSCSVSVASTIFDQVRHGWPREEDTRQATKDVSTRARHLSREL